MQTGASKDGEVTVTAEISAIETTCTGALCFLIGGESGEGEYYDKILVKGYEDSKTFHADETTHVWKGEHGPQVDIGVAASA